MRIVTGAEGGERPGQEAPGDAGRFDEEGGGQGTTKRWKISSGASARSPLPGWPQLNLLLPCALASAAGSARAETVARREDGADHNDRDGVAS